MKKFLLLSFLIFLQSWSLQAQWNKVESVSVNFKIKNAGIQVDGRFTSVSGQANLLVNDLSKSSFSGKVEGKSIQTGINLRDQHLRKDEYFSVQKFPVITMQSVLVSPTGPGTYEVSWELTMKGQTRRFSSSVTAIERNQQLILRSEFSINRRDWKIGGNSLTMSDQVKVILGAVLSR